MKALIVDNDTASVDLVRETLEFYDFSVIAVSSPEALSKLLKKNKFDVMVADISLTGIECLDSIDIPSIIMTGIKGLTTEERKTLFCRKIPFLAKPIAPTKLINTIKVHAQGYAG
ncbi:MAG: response regulator [Candidatus Auribacterota bacterium]